MSENIDTTSSIFDAVASIPDTVFKNAKVVRQMQPIFLFSKKPTTHFQQRLVLVTSGVVSLPSVTLVRMSCLGCIVIVQGCLQSTEPEQDG